MVLPDLRVRRVTINFKRLEVRVAKKDPNMSLPLAHDDSRGARPHNHNFEIPASRCSQSFKLARPGIRNRHNIQVRLPRRTRFTLRSLSVPKRLEDISLFGHVVNGLGSERLRAGHSFAALLKPPAQRVKEACAISGDASHGQAQILEHLLLVHSHRAVA